MKKLFFLAAAFTALTASAQNKKADELVKVNAESHSFGKIKQGQPVTTFFEIRNVSDRPVVIESATAGCGCTTPEYSKEPIAPNGATRLKVGYNAAAPGPFNKEVYVKLAGTTEPKIIRITGEVLDAAAYDAYVKSDEYKKAQAAKKSTAKPKAPAKSK